MCSAATATIVTTFGISHDKPSGSVSDPKSGM